MAEFMSLRDAIAANLKDGDSVAMEGFTHLIPYAAGHEVIRQGQKDLTLIRMTPDIIYDQIVGLFADANPRQKITRALFGIDRRCAAHAHREAGC